MPNSDALKSKIHKEMSELTGAINGILETFRSMKNPLVESREKVPQATDQLDKISEQTEAATHQMLDRIEQITQREEELCDGLQQLKSDDNGANGERIDQLIEKSTANVNDAYMIMDALQFQDITSQQMNHAASLLEEIEIRLHNLSSALGGEGESADQPAEAKKDRVYDPHADLFEKRTDQSAVDSLFAQAKDK